MRELTKEQAEFVAHLNSPEWREEYEKRIGAEEARAAELRAEYEKKMEAHRAAYEEERRQRRQAVKPIKEALRAAGIKLEFDGYYDGAWMRFQIGDGPVVDVEEGLYAFDAEDFE